MFEFLRLGLKPTVRVQRERAEAGALLRLCCKHISKKRNAVKRERARCNLTTGLICTDTLIILDSPLCEGVFRLKNYDNPQKSNCRNGLFSDCTASLIFS